MNQFYPEGSLLGSSENSAYLRSAATLEEARQQGRILEARAVVCDSQHNLMVDLGFTRGVIPRCEGALGIEDGSTRDIAIISKVNKAVCFTVSQLISLPDGSIQPVLSRREAQQLCRSRYLSQLVPGDIIPGRVTHLEVFGAFVDIGCGLPSLIPIDQISVSRIAHPRDRFAVGDCVYGVVKSVDADCRVCLTHKELLGTWLENVSRFSAGMTVPGYVRGVKDYGLFVEL
ncbi:MAG: S1 RNA-binding domain-containing protein, partial [Angelakisella sp.]